MNDELVIDDQGGWVTVGGTRKGLNAAEGGECSKVRRMDKLNRKPGSVGLRKQ